MGGSQARRPRQASLPPPAATLIVMMIAAASASDNWKEDMNEEERDIHRFAMENGLWTPDPEVLVGPPEGNVGEDAAWGILAGGTAVFGTRNNSIVSVQAGAPASLPCTVVNVHASETVSWIRRHDSHLLSLGDQTYSSDDRVTAMHDRDSQTWTLTIQRVTTNDSGVYECQLSSHPPRALFTTLVVLQSVSIIAGTPDMHVEAGSDVTLVCALRHFTRPPAYVFWYHEHDMINYDTSRKVSVSIQGGESRLLLRGVSHRDSGNYTCQPANARPSSITLHIIPGETPAAMQGAAGHTLTLTLTSLTLILAFTTLQLSTLLCLHYTS